MKTKWEVPKIYLILPTSVPCTHSCSLNLLYSKHGQGRSGTSNLCADIRKDPSSRKMPESPRPCSCKGNIPRLRIGGKEECLSVAVSWILLLRKILGVMLALRTRVVKLLLLRRNRGPRARTLDRVRVWIGHGKGPMKRLILLLTPKERFCIVVDALIPRVSHMPPDKPEKKRGKKIPPGPTQAADASGASIQAAAKKREHLQAVQDVQPSASSHTQVNPPKDKGSIRASPPTTSALRAERAGIKASTAQEIVESPTAARRVARHRDHRER